MTDAENAGRPRWMEAQMDARGLAALRRAATRRRVRPDRDRAGAAGADLGARVDPAPGGPGATQSRGRRPCPSRPRDAWGAPRILRDGALRRKGDERAGGIPLTLNLDRDVEREVTAKYRASGYPLADTEVRWVYTDAAGTTHRVAQAERLTTDQTGLCREHADNRVAFVDTEVSVYEGRKAKFGTTLIRGNFKTRRYVLKREVDWNDGDDYNRRKVDSTRTHIEGTGVVETVNIREQPTDCELTDDPERPCVVHEVVSITEGKDRLMDLSYGAGAATLDPLYGFVRPTFPNVFGTAWDLRLDAHVGANLPGLRSAFCSGEDCYERSGGVALERKRIFASPLTFEISTQFQRRVTPARGQIDSALGQVKLSWPLGPHWRLYAGYLIQIANISKDLVKPTLGAETGCGSDGMSTCRPPNRSEAIVPDRTGGLQSGATWERVDNSFNPDDGFIADDRHALRLALARRLRLVVSLRARLAALHPRAPHSQASQLPLPAHIRPLDPDPGPPRRRHAQHSRGVALLRRRHTRARHPRASSRRRCSSTSRRS